MIKLIFLNSLVDVSHAGDGQLEVLVENGSIPCNIVQTSNGHFSVTFVPREAKVHQIVVKFNGQQVKGEHFLIDFKESCPKLTQNQQEAH